MYNYKKAQSHMPRASKRTYVVRNTLCLLIPLCRKRQSGKLGSSVPRAEQHQKAACLSSSASLHLRQGLAVIDGAGSLDEIARMSHASKAAAFLPGMVLL